MEPLEERGVRVVGSGDGGRVEESVEWRDGEEECEDRGGWGDEGGVKEDGEVRLEVEPLEVERWGEGWTVKKSAKVGVVGR